MLKTRDDPAGAEARDTDAEDMTGAELGVTVSDTVLEVARPPESVTVTVAVCVPEVAVRCLRYGVVVFGCG